MLQDVQERRNPLSLAALVPSEVEDEARFVRLTPGDASSVQRGRFKGTPYHDAHGDHVVGVHWDNEPSPVSIELYRLGIAPTRESGEWRNVITISETAG